MRGWVELDAKRLIRVTAFNFDGGRNKTKVIPAGSDIATDTNIPPKTVTGSITVTGTDEENFEVDWFAYCEGSTKHTFVRHFSATERKLLREVEFTTYSAPLPRGDTEFEMTVNWIATERVDA